MWLGGSLGPLPIPVSALLGVAVALAGWSYLVLAIWRVFRWRGGGSSEAPSWRPGVSVLKPLCGAEPGLYDCLRSFCDQDYSELQLVLGVADPGDAAVAVARRLIADRPERDIALVIDGTQHGTNRKVSNLVNMERVARHDILVVSDSDTIAAPHSLARVVAPLARPKVGAVTCLYRGAPRSGLCSALGALFISDWFLPSAVVDAGMRDVAYCFGPLTAVRRDALEAIGGLGRLAFRLADDFLLGRLIASAGFRVVLSGEIVDTVVAETFASLVAHELRWSRTVRTVKPGEHFLSCAMHPLPLLLAVLPAYPAYGVALIAVHVALRTALHYLARRRFAIPGPARAWLLPLRECLVFAIWALSFAGSSVRWRERRFAIGHGGTLLAQEPGA